MNVLIVDDEEDICGMVCRILHKIGVGCDMANDVGTAYQKTLSTVYDIYILDITLPDGTGLDLIPVIKRKAPEADVVIISAHDDQESKEKAVLMGAHTFIKKPFTKSEILSLVSN